MGLFFTLLPPPEKWKFQKNEEKPYRYNHFTLVYQKSWLYAILFLRNGMWQMYLLFFILTIFCPFTPLTAQKTKISKNFKKCLEISSFYTSVPKTMIICTKNHDYMLYCSWDMTHDGCNCCFSFWAIFYPFTPLTAWKIRISKKWEIKMPEGIIVLHNCTKNYDYWLYCSWDMVRDGCNCYFSFWAIFYPFTP